TNAKAEETYAQPSTASGALCARRIRARARDGWQLGQQRVDLATYRRWAVRRRRRWRWDRWLRHELAEQRQQPQRPGQQRRGDRRRQQRDHTGRSVMETLDNLTTLSPDELALVEGAFLNVGVAWGDNNRVAVGTGTRGLNF